MTLKTQTYAGQPPCKDCTERHIKCHAECDRYKQWSDKLSAIKANKEKEISYAAYYHDAVTRHDSKLIKGSKGYRKRFKR